MKKPTLLAAGLAVVVLLCGFSYILDDQWDPTNSNYVPTNLPIKWPAGTVPVTIMLGTTPTLTDGTNYSTSVQAGANIWNTLIGDIQLQTTIASGTPTRGNHVNEIGFDSKVYGTDFGTNVLAVTTTSYFGSGANRRSEGDIIFNTAYTWDSYRGTYKSSPIDIQRVAIHELGHLLGLDHPDEATPKQTVEAIMNSHASSIDAPKEDDISGAQGLYGPPGTPPNDNFANATLLTLPTNSLKASATGYNTNASRETGEPLNAGNAGGRSVWWKWTSPYDGTATIDTRGSYFDTTLGIYTGTALSSLTAVGTQDQADDIQAGSSVGQQIHIQASSITFPVTANTTYYISVDGFNSAPRNTYGADSAGITVNLNINAPGGTAPTITTQPASVTTNAGFSASFSVTASGTAPLTYQWFLGGSAIADATSSSYTVSSAQSGNAGNYTVSITNAFGSVTSNVATLTVNPVVVTPPPASSGGGGGGGGGAPSDWFLGALAVLTLLRWKQRRH